MLNIDLERLLYAVKIDFKTEVTKIAEQVFSVETTNHPAMSLPLL